MMPCDRTLVWSPAQSAWEQWSAAEITPLQLVLCSLNSDIMPCDRTLAKVNHLVRSPAQSAWEITPLQLVQPATTEHGVTPE